MPFKGISNLVDAFDSVLKNDHLGQPPTLVRGEPGNCSVAVPFKYPLWVKSKTS